MFKNFFLKKQFCFLSRTKPTVLITSSNNIVFNLSTEEYLYEHQNIEKPVLLLYQNDKNIVIGKHQNPWKECNFLQMENDNINLARNYLINS
jgi:lipoate-protein ligase A